jgi:hypothetical protein
MVAAASSVKMKEHLEDRGKVLDRHELEVNKGNQQTMKLTMCSSRLSPCRSMTASSWESCLSMKTISMRRRASLVSSRTVALGLCRRLVVTSTNWKPSMLGHGSTSTALAIKTEVVSAVAAWTDFMLLLDTWPTSTRVRRGKLNLKTRETAIRMSFNNHLKKISVVHSDRPDHTYLKSSA